MTNQTPDLREAVEIKLGKFNIASRQASDDDYKPLETFLDDVMQLLQTEIAKATNAARLDENDIWLSHSTARRLNDNMPAIATVDFNDRIKEITDEQLKLNEEG